MEPEDFLFGYPFFEAARSSVDWYEAWVEGLTTVSIHDANEWKAKPKGSKRRNKAPLRV